MEHFMKFAFALLAAVAVVQPSAGKDAAIDAGNVEVVVADDATKTAQFAAADLTNHLAMVFGRTVPLLRSPGKRRIQIFVGDSAWSRKAGIDVADLPRDAFRIKCTGGRIYLAGRDDPGCDLGAIFAFGEQDRKSTRLNSSHD